MGEHDVSTTQLLGVRSTHQNINVFYELEEKSEVHTMWINQRLPWNAKVGGPFLPFA